ncbi:MAG: hypothetical protein OHK0013_06850 [Sandaracinaceae bacterium]
MTGPHFRRSARNAVDLRVSFRLDANDAELRKEGRVSDLGMGGIFVSCATPPPAGTAVRLFFSLPSAWDPVELSAIVRWVSATGFGAEFRGLGAREAEALHELVQRLGFEEDGS